MKKLIGLIIVTGLLLAGCAQSSPVVETPSPPPDLYDKVWISPAEVDVGNFYAGARAEWLVTIHNGNDKSAKFSVTYSQPSTTAEGFVTAPTVAQDWIIIADATPVLAAKETKEVLIAVEMPKGATAPKKWEFLIVVKDVTQTGMIQTELACRWLVTMK